MPPEKSTSNTASPAAAASPPVLAPSSSTLVNMSLAPGLTTAQAPSIFTHKQWVLPPRPKPGRKPAADTPPTKRKAQNRQAQRAFRERRAARVGELEEQMKKIEDEDAREQADLRGQIHQLEADLLSHNELLLSWRRKMQELEAIVTKERELREAAEIEAAKLRNGQKPSTEALPAPSTRSDSPRRQQMAQSSLSGSDVFGSDQDMSMGCGKCSQTTRCECIEQAFDIADFATNDSDPPGKRPHSPPANDENKRFRQDPFPEPQGNEIDFTARFSSKKPPNLITSSSSISLPAAATNPDPCGFCQDDSPCICAEMAMEAVKSQNRFGTSADEAASSARSNPCVNGPGTCAQCLTDANSTLFCKSLAATRPGYRPYQTTASPPKESDVYCEELPPTPSSSTDFPASESRTSPPITGPTLTCADAYETLSRHPAFDRASEELSTWMPQLATVPGGRERTAFEVEAASVMGVLKFFDRRFGKTPSKDGI
ncbi:MAG: hypothetical protein LQ345_003348 [Seirophora villosa]|nr:MAG: hypothetical protein LQ345_003348 [Seirophora villosa]